MERRKAKQVHIGKITIGGNAPIAVQSMLCAPAHDTAANVEQAVRLEQAGCQIVRVAVPDQEAVQLIPALKKAVSMPIVADIHFDWRLAIEAIAAGVDKIRLNPGNIGDASRVKAVADACSSAGIPIRIGVNGGSLEKHILAKYGHVTPEALKESALYHAALLERFDFHDIVISIKASDVPTMVEACKLTAQACPYPLHLGVTEAGTERSGAVKSAVVIGSLLLSGIGDTIRVSLTADPVREIATAKAILSACGLRKEKVELISCPTCGRTRIDIMGLTEKLEGLLQNVKTPLKVAVMGCAVNGPGEARNADIGIAGGDGIGLLFKKGKIIKRVPEEALLNVLMEEIRAMDCGKESE
mgnify:CR=1 FL=1